MPSKSSTPVALRFPNDLIAQLDALASSRSCSRPEAIRLAVNAGLAALRQSPAEELSAEPKKRGRKPRAELATLAAASAKAQSKRRAVGAKGASAEATPAAEFDLVTFAAQVIEAAQRTETGRFGDDRVFISHVWRQFEQEHKPAGMDLEAFKRRLVEANQGRFLSLAQAAGARKREGKDVEESETSHGADTFHLVRL